MIWPFKLSICYYLATSVNFDHYVGWKVKHNGLSSLLVASSVPLSRPDADSRCSFFLLLLLRLLSLSIAPQIDKCHDLAIQTINLLLFSYIRQF
jgi:hypothetical protein